MNFKRLSNRAIAPKRATAHAAGLDLYTPCEFTLWPEDRRTVDLELAIEIPDGHVGLIWPRSGKAANFGIDTLAGVIDADYRGSVGVVLLNTGQAPVYYKEGDAIAQLLVQPCEFVDAVEVEELTDTERGEGGFGSTDACQTNTAS
jgi:dUTP pyrophosphatase